MKTHIPDADFRALVRLMGRTICLPVDLQGKRRTLLDGLLVLTGSQGWIWQLWQEGRTEPTTLASGDGPHFILPESNLPVENPSALQILPNCILGQRHFLTGETGRIAILREISSPSYGRREILVIRMLLEEIPWLYRTEWERGTSRQDILPQRQKDVLIHISKGRTRKEISSLMKISAHTVSDYMKIIFATYGVHSQAELMNLFYKGTITIRQ